MWRTDEQRLSSTRVVQNTNIGIVFSSGPFPLKGQARALLDGLVYGDDLDDVRLQQENGAADLQRQLQLLQAAPYTPIVKAVAGDRKVFLYWDDRAEESRDPFLGFENETRRRDSRRTSKAT